MHSKEQDDRDLVLSAQGGNCDAFAQLFQRRRDRLYNLLLRTVGSREEAEDIVQLAFLQAFVHLTKFRCESDFFSWLYRIAVNAAIQAARRRRPTISLELSQRVQEALSFDQNPQESLEKAERATMVQTGLDALPPSLRVTLVLREIEGCNYEQIADILSIPVGSVRSRLHRARAQLRTYLLSHFKFDPGAS